MNERDTDIRRICLSALERPSEQRSAFVAAACGGDEALRREVESLLAQDAAANRFLETPALEVAAQLVHRATDSALALAPGCRVGPYEVHDVIGAGGMGQVYRARDTVLHRDVALKVLPDAFARDRERLARFQREAQVLASLNHPNIGTIHGLEEAGQVMALVLELVDGPTLEDRIARGAMPLEDVLPIARQIADALEAAHSKGIVHRDLKPANIKVRPDGIVKVLDFGLAKILEGQVAGSALSHSPAGMESTPGMVLGTAAYMSPEQSKGKGADRTTDVWAFGCVLFEMLTGRAAFEGDSLTDVLAAILKTEPDWPLLPPNTPESIRRLLRRCLQKDLKLRLRDIGDARLEINEGQGELVAPAPSSDHSPKRRMRTIVLIAAITGTAAMVAGVALGTRLTRWFTAPTPAPVTRTEIPTSGLSISSGVDISPDGRRSVYVSGDGTQLFMRALDALDAIPIVTGQAITWPIVSPDGQWVAFFDGAPQVLKRVPMSGGLPTPVAEQPEATGARGAAWVTDDTIVVASSSGVGGLWLVPSTGGSPTRLTTPDASRGEAQHLWPERLPGGRDVLFTVIPQTGGLEAAQIVVLNLATKRQKVLIRGGSHARYFQSGHLIYTAAGTLRAVPFDLGTLEVHGTGAPLVPRVLTTAQGGSRFALAEDGALVYLDVPNGAAVVTARTLTWVDRSGRETSISAPPREYIFPRLSPDGRRLALDVGTDPVRGIYVWDFMRATLTPLTIDRAINRNMEWTRDSKRIIYTSNRGGADNLWWQFADGSGSPERLTTSPNVQMASGSTPDGAAMIFFERMPGTQNDLMQIALDGSHQVTTVLQTPANERNGIVSPDSRLIAYQSDESGHDEIYVQPFPNLSGGKWKVSTNGGTRPMWAPDGKELYYVASAHGDPIMRVVVPPIGSTWQSSTPIKLFDGYAVTNPTRTYDVARDGRFLMMKASLEGQPPAPRLIVVQHWDQEVKAQVPIH